MNDPHVVALEYRIEHGPDIDWSRAVPLAREEDRFRVHVETGRVRFEFKDHHASEDEARLALEDDYIPNWELVVGLERGPDAFRLRFDRSDIVDRNPPPGPLTLSAHASFGPLKSTANLAPPTPPAFPEPPPAALKRSPDVDTMYQRYLRHLEGREPLPAMAYFCLTMLEHIAGSRREAARRFAISDNVLQKIGTLCGKGGGVARKRDGLGHPYTPEEERFLKAAIRTLIRRAAEVEFASDPNRRQITLDDI